MRGWPLKRRCALTVLAAPRSCAWGAEAHRSPRGHWDLLKHLWQHAGATVKDRQAALQGGISGLHDMQGM